MMSWMICMADVTMAEIYGQTASITAWMAAMVALTISRMTGMTVVMMVWMSVHVSVIIDWMTGIFAVIRSVICWMTGATVAVTLSTTCATASMIVPRMGTRLETIVATSGATAATMPRNAVDSCITAPHTEPNSVCSGPMRPVRLWSAGASDEAMLPTRPLTESRNCSFVA